MSEPKRMRLKYGNSVLLVLLAVFYATIAYQNLKPSGLLRYEHIAAHALTNDPTDQPINYGARRALVAIGEQKAGVRETNKGCNCGQRVDQYTAGLHQQWCAMFVSWVFKEAGTPLKGPDKAVPWRITNARQIAAYLKKNGVWYPKEQVTREHLKPRVGDVMVFWRGNFEGNLGHADIVVGVDPNKPGHASLIGGNLYDKVLYRESSYFEEYYGFLGFGRLRGEESSAETKHASVKTVNAKQPFASGHSKINDPRLRQLFDGRFKNFQESDIQPTQL